MNMVKPVSEEFLYCDPECIHDDNSIEDRDHPCHLCLIADQLAVSDDEIKRLRHEH